MTFNETVQEADRLEAQAASQSEAATYYGTIITDLRTKVDTGRSLRDSCLIDTIGFVEQRLTSCVERSEKNRIEATRLRSEFGRRP